jgi:protein-S-isoprenylcysteine O-methyltransferase Ste14
MAAIVVALFLGPRWPEAWSGELVAVGVLVALVGALVGFAAARALGSGLSPYPRPPQGARLVERGPYRHVRHPFYSGGALFLGGLSLVFSQSALLLTVALVAVWALKAVVEERFLVAAHPGYASYAERTRYRMLPRVF